ncbi:MAG TPA: tail fiber domain-containing protein [Saprospiraceae bacterium]|nr:tail fiber domain-containing protein [Saprospiraceae bacterium]
MKKINLLLVFIIPIISIVQAQIPRLISYQGVLTDQQGSFIPDGTHSLTLKIYENLSGGNPIYIETQNTLVTKGLFNISIGAINPIPLTINFDKPYFLGVSVDFGAEMSPRTVLTSVPYSLRAEKANIAESLAPGASGVVTSINSTQGNINIVGGGGTTVNQNGNTITISSSGGGGQGIQGIQNSDGILSIQNANGPTATIGIRTSGVTEEQCLVYRSGAWQIAQKSKYNFDPEIFQETNTIPFLGLHNISLKTSGVNENHIPKFRDGRWQFLPPLEISAGAGINLSTITPGPDKITIAAADISPTNEIQSLSFNSSTKQLSISQGNSVDLSSLSGSGSQLWLSSGTAIYNSNSGNVGIGTSSPSQKLHVYGNMRLEGGLYLGSTENIYDGGSNTIAINSTFRPDNSASRDLGTSNIRWRNLFLDGDVSLGNKIIFGGGDFLAYATGNQILSSSTFIPQFNGTRDLGVTSSRWRNLYLSGSVFFGNSESISDGGSNTIAINSTFRPDATGVRDLGTSTTRFRDIYLSGRILFGNNESLSDGGTNIIVTNSTLIPDAIGSRDLGTSSKSFRDLHLGAKLVFGGNDFISYTIGNQIVSSSTFMPNSNANRDLGTSSFRWRKIYLSTAPDVSSDTRLKEKIKPIQYGLNEVLQMNPVSYVLKADETQELQLGLLAQELKTIIPSIVHGDESKEMLSVSYTELIPILINALKEQQKQIEELKKSNTTNDSIFTAEEIKQLKSLLTPVALIK